MSEQTIVNYKGRTYINDTIKKRIAGARAAYGCLFTAADARAIMAPFILPRPHGKVEAPANFGYIWWAEIAQDMDRIARETPGWAKAPLLVSLTAEGRLRLIAAILDYLEAGLVRMDVTATSAVSAAVRDAVLKAGGTVSIRSGMIPLTDEQRAEMEARAVPELAVMAEDGVAE